MYAPFPWHHCCGEASRKQRSTALGSVKEAAGSAARHESQPPVDTGTGASVLQRIAALSRTRHVVYVVEAHDLHR